VLPRRRSHWTHNGNSGAIAISRLTRSSLNASMDRQAGFSSSWWRDTSSSSLVSRARSSHVKIRFSEAQRVSPFDTRVNTWRFNERSTFISTVRVTRARVKFRQWQNPFDDNDIRRFLWSSLTFSAQVHRIRESHQDKSHRQVLFRIDSAMIHRSRTRDRKRC